MHYFYFCTILFQLFLVGVSVADTTTNTPSTTLKNTTGATIPETFETNTTQDAVLANISTTTVTPTTMKTIDPVTTTPKPEMRSPFCFCDQRMNLCEVNCCCDLDCSPKDKEIFSKCDDYDTISSLGSITSSREKSCFRKDFIYSNNTPYSVHRESSDLFCMVSDNFRKEQVWEIPSSSQLKSMQNKPSFRWTSLASLNMRRLNISMKGYKYGSLILTAHQSEIFNETEFQVNYFELPSNLHGKSCLGHEPIKFLQDSDIICQYEMYNFATKCATFFNFNANNYFDTNTSIIGTIDLKSNEDKLINCTFTICQRNSKNPDAWICAESAGNDIPSPIYASNQCKNVLESVHVTIVHEGINGISNVLAQIHLNTVNDPKNSDVVKLQQEFIVRFFWKDDYTNPTGKNSTRVDLPKSGNPGYLIGKEVILGTLISSDQFKSNLVDEDGNTTFIKLDDYSKDDAAEKGPFGIGLLHDENFYASILNAGDCHEKNRRSILFGMNMKSSCSISLSKYKYCEKLGDELGIILLGIHPMNFTQNFIASFGNPFILQSMNDWIPISILNNPFSSTPNSVSLVSNGCVNNGLVNSLHIQIIYAQVGPVVFPQAQIRAVIYEFGEQINLKPTEKGVEMKMLTLSTTVGFQDITSVPVHKMAQWPTISIQLPSDFFYPFSSSKGTTHHLGREQTIYVLLQLLLFQIFIGKNTCLVM